MKFLRNLFGRWRGVTGDAPLAPAVAATDWISLGNAALGQGDLLKAAACYQSAVTADPRHPLARLNLGFVLLELRDVQGADDALAHAVALRRQTDDFLHEALFLMGRSRLQQQQFAQALSHFEEALEVKPLFAEAMEAKAQVLHAMQRNAEALKALEELLALQADHRDALALRGQCLFELDRTDESLRTFEHLLSLDGPSADTCSSMAAALGKAGRFEEALAFTQQALALEPGHRNALVNQCRALCELLLVTQASELATRALDLYPNDPDLKWCQATSYLLLGKLEAGWPGYEMRWEAFRNPRPNHGKPYWDGKQSLSGRAIFVYAEQGFGDSIQFLRYVPGVAAEAAQVYLQLPPALHALATDLPSNCSMVQDPSTIAFDFECALLSLPFAFRSSLDTLPAKVPYLKANAARVNAWRERHAQEFPRLPSVGVVWSGNPAHANDRNRSIPLSVFRLMAIEGCRFFSLQPQVRDADMPALAQWQQLHCLDDALVDFGDTAALMETLDLIITVDTSVAHLAGALARPVWILLPHCPDWRWLLDRVDSPWYPTARLFRQPAPRTWEHVAEEVRVALADFVAQWRAKQAATDPA